MTTTRGGGAKSPVDAADDQTRRRPSPPDPRNAMRAVVTILATLGVIVGEFWLLTAVYHLGDGARADLVAQSRVIGALSSAAPGDPAAGAQVVAAARALERLDATGAAQQSRRISEWVVSPSPAGLTGLRDRADAIRADLSGRAELRDRQADLIHGGLLLAVSVGWFWWFRGVVRRHRELEHAVTERAVIDVGERRILALVENSFDLVAVLEADSQVSFVSPSSVSLLGVSPDELQGRRLVDLLSPADASKLISMLDSTHDGVQALRLHLDHADGRSLVLEGSLSNQLAEPAIDGWVLSLHDVTAQHELQQELAHQAFHDPLTGLANRQLFADRLSHALLRRDAANETLAVMFCDLDDFKNVNDSLGHSVGDQLLVTVGERIAASVREGDTAARLGGDEFAILMESASVQDARVVADRMLLELALPIVVEGESLTVGASIGIAEATPGQATDEDTLRNADVAMYWAKERGKGTVAIYDPEHHALDLEQMALRSDLRRAIAGDELVLHYQPTVDLVTGEIHGFEALVRWEHPEMGLLSPAAFVPMAERSGLVVPMGSWVLREACRAGASMQTGPRRASVAVNISSQQLARSTFVAEVASTLVETGMPASQLVLEITETQLLDDLDQTVTALNALREQGVVIAIDDFGTGYSSLSYLSKLPVDILKMDKSFVDVICSGSDDASLAEAILAMSRSLRLRTVAEGVEELEQAAWLQDAGCELGQGYLWSRPVSLERARALLADPTPIFDPTSTSRAGTTRPVSAA